MNNNQELTQLQSEIANILNIEAADPDMPLAQLGIDSLNVVELILVCQQIYTNIIDISTITFDEHSTLREINKCLLENSLQ